MSATLQIRLLGVPEVVVAEKPALDTLLSKAQALLYYLAVTGEPQSRMKLASLLWGDMPETAARTNLRKALSNLRMAIDTHLEIDNHLIALKPESDFWVDVRAFEAHLKKGLTAAEPQPLQAAVELYRGDFLSGFSVRHAPDFEAWLAVEQTRLRELFIQALQTLAEYHARQGSLSQAIATIRRLLNLEPWREEAHRQLMGLLAQDGHRSAALAQYESCRQALAEELGVEPSPETVALYEDIRKGKIGRVEDSGPLLAPDGLAAAPAKEEQPIKFSTASPPPTPASGLPPQPTPFIGRQQELADLLRRLQDPGCRLLTVVGPGGIGKTRLALQAAQTLLEMQPKMAPFADGVLFVALTPVNTQSGIVSAIAEAAAFQFYRDGLPDQQLLEYLREKQLLLILDNFEHLQESAGLISEILAAVPGVKLLITSRTALNIQEAWFHPLAGLSYPPPGAPEAEAGQYDAIRLFESCARRAQVNFSLAAEQESIRRICQLVEGMPLGIELAAAWLKVLPAKKIAQEIEKNLDILTSRYQNVPERHRSMRVVLEQSWQLLAGEEQQALQQLAVFQGGFYGEAAEMVTGASLMMLASLVEKSLLRVTATGRYQMHELLRQFAAEKLAADPQEEAITRERHSAFYLRFLKACERQLKGGEQLTALHRISEDIDNIRRGWQWAIAQGHLATITQALDALYNFYQIRSRYQEGQELFAQAISQLQFLEPLAAVPEFEAILHRLALRCGAFSHFLGDYEAARQRLEATLPALNSPRERAFGLLMLGEVSIALGNRPLGESRLQESLILYQDIGDKSGIANALHKLAVYKSSFGDYIEGKRLAEQTLRLSRQLGRVDWEGYALDVLGWTTFALGAYDESEAYYRESQAVFNKIEDQLGLALALGGIGAAAWARGGEALAEAKQYMSQSLELCRAIGNRYHASARLWYLAEISHDAQDYAAAQAYGEAGLALAEEVHSPIFASYNLCALGEIACSRGNFQTAREYLLQALEIASEAWQLPPLTIALFNLAVLFMKESEALPPPLAQEKRLQALEQLLLLADQPACWHIFKQRAAQVRARLEDVLPPELVQSAERRAQQMDLKEVVTGILNSPSPSALP